MIKIIFRNVGLFSKFASTPILKEFVFFDLSQLHRVNNSELFVKIIDQVRMSNGTYKTTHNSRLKDVDTELVKIVDRTIPKLIIHDVAVSDGITAVDLYDELEKNGLKSSIQISDKFSTVYCRKKRFIKVYRDSEGNCLYGDFFGILASAHLSRRYIISRLLSYLLPKKCEIRASDVEINLVNPKTRNMLINDDFNFRFYDVFESDPDKGVFDIVRCMNLLTPTLFSTDEINNGLERLILSLRSGGLLIVGRSDVVNLVNNVTIFEKKSKGMMALIDINQGSEVSHLVTNIKTADSE